MKDGGWLPFLSVMNSHWLSPDKERLMMEVMPFEKNLSFNSFPIPLPHGSIHQDP